jgi:hypothetical protein
VTAVILTIRTWALWESNRKLGVFLVLLFVITWVPTFILVEQQNRHAVERELPVDPPLHKSRPTDVSCSHTYSSHSDSKRLYFYGSQSPSLRQLDTSRRISAWCVLRHKSSLQDVQLLSSHSYTDINQMVQSL